MRVTIYEYYCDCCKKKVETEKDLIEASLILKDEQCEYEQSTQISRIYAASGNEKHFCKECYNNYRSLISKFTESLELQFGIETNARYKK